MSKIIMMVGISGSGKTTYVRELAANLGTDLYNIYSLNHQRLLYAHAAEKIETKYRAWQEPTAEDYRIAFDHAAANNRNFLDLTSKLLTEYLKKAQNFGMPLIVDNMNLSEPGRYHSYKTAAKYKLPVYLHVMDTPLNVCLARNATTKELDADVLEKQYELLQANHPKDDQHDSLKGIEYVVYEPETAGG